MCATNLSACNTRIRTTFCCSFHRNRFLTDTNNHPELSILLLFFFCYGVGSFRVSENTFYIRQDGKAAFFIARHVVKTTEARTIDTLNRIF